MLGVTVNDLSYPTRAKFCVGFFEHNMKSIPDELCASINQNVIQPLLSRLCLGTSDCVIVSPNSEYYELHLNPLCSCSKAQRNSATVNIAKLSVYQSGSWSQSRNIEILGNLSKFWSMQVSMEFSRTDQTHPVSDKAILLNGRIFMPRWPSHLYEDETARHSNESCHSANWLEHILESQWFRFLNSTKLDSIEKRK